MSSTTSYTPTMKPRHWKGINHFVESSVSKCLKKTPYSSADLYQATSRMAAWVDAQPDLLLDEATVFAPATVEQFIQEGLPAYAPASRGNRRSMLLRMSETILGSAAHRAQSGALPASSPSVPYSVDEVRSVQTWASAQSGDRRKSARVLAAAGLGAGLSTGEITALRVADIVTTANETFIAVTGARPRRVLVDRKWASALRGSVKGREPKEWAFCPSRAGAGKNLVTNFVARSTSTEVRPNAQRMRATWLVGRLQSGESAIAMMINAGVTSLGAITRYITFTQGPTGGESCYRPTKDGPPT